APGAVATFGTGRTGNGCLCPGAWGLPVVTARSGPPAPALAGRRFKPDRPDQRPAPPGRANDDQAPRQSPPGGPPGRRAVAVAACRLGAALVHAPAHAGAAARRSGPGPALWRSVDVASGGGRQPPGGTV